MHQRRLALSDSPTGSGDRLFLVQTLYAASAKPLAPTLSPADQSLRLLPQQHATHVSASRYAFEPVQVPDDATRQTLATLYAALQPLSYDLFPAQPPLSDPPPVFFPPAITPSPP